MMQRTTPHIKIWSVLLGGLLLLISMSGSTLPRSEGSAQRTEEAPSEARLSAKPSLKAILKNAPVFTFSHYFWLPEGTAAHAVAQRKVALKARSVLHSVPELLNVFPSVHFLTRCLLCSPNAP